MTANPHSPSDAELDSRFCGVFERIAQGAIAREQARELAYEPVAWLKEAGFTSLRIPHRYGGGNISLQQLFRQLIRLGEADSNLPQILRAHFAFIEVSLEGDETRRTQWFPHLVQGQTVGSATSERTSETSFSVTLTPDTRAGHWRLNGNKYYCTGTLYSEWISVAARDERSDINVVVPRNAAGVHCSDDWDGFGQRLTGSGSTQFDNVLVRQEQIVSRFDASQPRANTLQTAFVQTVHLAALAGIARAVLRDAVAFTRGRSRTFGVPGHSSPRDNPLVQRVIGRLGSLAYSTQSIVAATAAALDNVQRARQAELTSNEDYIAVDLEVFQAQQIVLEQTLEAATLLFEVGGASATSEGLRLDRHWRNARVLASHNPAAQREAAIGEFHLNGVLPGDRYSTAHTAGAAAPAALAAAQTYAA